MPDDGAQRRSLIVGTQRWKCAALLRRRTVAAAAEIVHAQNPVTPDIHAETRADEFGPPSLRARNDAVGGNAAEHGNHGSVLGTHEPESYLGVRQCIAVMQPEGLQPHGLFDLNRRFSGHVPPAPYRGLHNPCSAGARSPLQRKCEPAQSTAHLPDSSVSPSPQELAPFQETLKGI